MAPQGCPKYLMWVEEGSGESWRVLLGVRKAIEKSYATEDLIIAVAREVLIKKVPMTIEFYRFLMGEGFCFVKPTFPQRPGVVK